ncbi:MAG: hypothetical protein A2418_00465 [Candidatus Brennerbacteria bacterium RIFOXYC1_FULL_41_11]|uniref:EfeO-type cupredoxin-like domain-containing protein n=1 Tax=Candidatus Brennerbacteria bacterium RIFOXYD1_FULL_41_16 TaxID=1797529 RepID=A0A1G1XJS0_9BACT|nr:MAG: hypothetical protein A2391_01925 [Candidatus Brennerbacteria bacterium RIFOXYB1_FULL_41_13]OGY39709.1 MAG: hypothetical protein A2418_00465 [Candidatus Brennerbacteria bacterium RIFOXYC1_FULL_41_11]OGY40333.1 MAG: hypothetical protein A2570_03590 [Candidatus Brennerbacteria bacterium RIFOXYD1_FULL_41_16]
MKKSYLIYGGSAVLLLVVVLLLVYSSPGQPVLPVLAPSPTPIISVSPTESPVISSAASSLPTSPSEAPRTGAVRDFVFTASDFKYSLTELRVKKGDLVKIVLQNKEGFHDLKIDEFGVATEKLRVGQEDVVEFVADKIGTFEYYCSIGSHRLMGMKGNLIVE